MLKLVINLHYLLRKLNRFDMFFNTQAEKLENVQILCPRSPKYFGEGIVPNALDVLSKQVTE